MKEIKAFIHVRRAADVLGALKEAECSGIRINNLAVFPVQALMKEPGAEKTSYSLVLGGAVVNEVKVELLCPDEAVAPLVEVIRRTAYTGGAEEGWVVVTETLAAELVGNDGGNKP